jgi:hypothetical protein
MVFRVLGYASESGFLAESVTSQKCNATLFMRIVHRSFEGMHMYTVTDLKVHGKDFRSSFGSDRSSHRGAGSEAQRPCE